MKKLINKLFKIDTRLSKQDKTNLLLTKILYETKKTSILLERYNKAYNIK